MHTGIFVWSMLSYDNDDKLGLGGVCWWDDSSIDSIEFHFIPHLLSFEFRASSLRWATGLHGRQRCRLDDSWLLTQPILTLKGPERLSRNCAEHQSFTSRCFIDTLCLCESHAILSILLSGQLCTFWSPPPHGLIILPISFLCWFWKRVSNEKYQLQLRIIFLKGEADVYTKSGASWATEWDFGHLLEWVKSMLALACSYLSSLLQGRSDGKAMASMVLWTLGHDMTHFLRWSLCCGRRFNWPIVWWSCHWRDRSSSIHFFLWEWVLSQRFALHLTLVDLICHSQRPHNVEAMMDAGWW